MPQKIDLVVSSTSHSIREPLYGLVIKPFSWELDLLCTKTLRRLKHLHHFGGAALLSAVTHSRFEHTLGVWSLAAHFFPHDVYLRAAALLHDIGHFPFSHALERALQLDHHVHTIELIRGIEIRQILDKAQIDCEQVISILDADTPLANRNGFIGLDHLDSFLRDTYHAGLASRLPAEVINELTFSDNHLSTNSLATAQYISQLVILDHQLFLNPILLAADKLLANAVELHFQGKHLAEEIAALTDYDLLSRLQGSKQESVQELLNVLLYQPFRLREIPKDQEITAHGNTLELQVKKVYKETLKYKGISLLSQCQATEEAYASLDQLVRRYWVTY